MENKKNLYIIGYGLNGGFGGAQNYEVLWAKDEENANELAFECACEYYENYVGNYGLRTVEEIMDEDDLEEDDAFYQYQEERDSWLEYYAVEYSKENEEKVIGYHYENNYKYITDEMY